MDEKQDREKSPDKLHRINWIGLIAGILMILLTFQGAWWKAVLGEGVLKVALSPFHYDITLIGQSLTSPLVSYLILAAKISVIIGGGFLLLGSVGAKRWWGKKLVNWGAMKVFWMVLFLIIVLIIGAFLTNNYLASLLSGMIGAGTIQVELPYLIGTGHATIQAEGAITVSGPINVVLTRSFWMAVLTAGLGLGAKIYHKKMTKDEEKNSSTGKKTSKNN